MKAAVMFPNHSAPRYLDYPDPVAENEEQIIIEVRAAALKHLDKGRAAGTHYSSDAPPEEGRIIGGDGVGILRDGTRVYAMAVKGMMAEKATVHRSRIVPLPDGLDEAKAAALANAVIGSAMGLRFKAQIKPGDTVLVNGATGFTGRVAVQIARHYGAGRVIATGRNAASLQELPALGADEILSLSETGEVFSARLKDIHARQPIDIVLDYLWGPPAEWILAGTKGRGNFGRALRYVSVGSMAGDAITLSAANLRSTDLQLSGSGLGSWSREAVGLLFSEILPEMFRLAADGKLKVKTKTVDLHEIAGLWDIPVANGERLVVRI